MTDFSDVAVQQWDAVIIGTGIGGATLGLALARSGWRVLFCEKGKSQLAQQSLRGDYAETFFAHPGRLSPERSVTLARAGRCGDMIEDRSDAEKRSFVPFIGSGTGGSSALYGMAMERFFPMDFRPRRNFPNASGSSLPNAWPISYEELAPYYTSAEELYGVCGTADPLGGSVPNHLRPPPPLTPPGVALFELLQRRGLHPYRLPMACEFVPGCQCCQGYLCPRGCKRDSSSVCLQPALMEYGARLLDECEVVRLEATRSRVTGVICNWQGKQICLHGRFIVLAAGALASPGILLASASTSWPNGLANESGLVGRNLMRHFVDLYAVFFSDIEGHGDNRRKEVAFNDFYQVDGEKLGSVQSFGRLPPAPVLAESLQNNLSDSAGGWAATLFNVARPAVNALLSRVIEKTWVLASVVEDLPYADNRVSMVSGPSPHGGPKLAITYKIRAHDFARVKALRTLMRGILKPLRFLLIKQAQNNQVIAHACGTCRFGLDIRDSVLDRNNRAHGLENLYVVDSSFFPSSAGTNPGLTIAANALRVAVSIQANGI